MKYYFRKVGSKVLFGWSNVFAQKTLQNPNNTFEQKFNGYPFINNMETLL